MTTAKLHVIFATFGGLFAAAATMTQIQALNVFKWGHALGAGLGIAAFVLLYLAKSPLLNPGAPVDSGTPVSVTNPVVKSLILFLAAGVTLLGRFMAVLLVASLAFMSSCSLFSKQPPGTLTACLQASGAGPQFVNLLLNLLDKSDYITTITELIQGIPADAAAVKCVLNDAAAAKSKVGASPLELQRAARAAEVLKTI